MRRTSGWSTWRRLSTGIAGGTSSGPRPRRCGGFWWTTHDAKQPSEGGGLQSVDLTIRLALASEPRRRPVALDEALDELALGYPKDAELVELRYFAGSDDAAGRRSPERISAQRPIAIWAYARAWLRTRYATSETISKSIRRIFCEIPFVEISWQHFRTVYQRRSQHMAEDELDERTQIFDRALQDRQRPERTCVLGCKPVGKRPDCRSRFEALLRGARRRRDSFLDLAGSAGGHLDQPITEKPGTDRPLQAAAADRRRRHGRRLSWPSRRSRSSGEWP